MMNFTENYGNIELDIYTNIVNKEHTYDVRVNKKSKIADREDVKSITDIIRNSKNNKASIKELVIVGDYRLSRSELRKVHDYEVITFIVGIDEATKFSTENEIGRINKELNHETRKCNITAYGGGIMCIRIFR